MDSDILRVWQLVHELSDQLGVNQKLASTLQSQAISLKTQAGHSGTRFTLRRFNTDISKEAFESELERLNAQISIENQALSHENKQLSQLLKEYETTMETIMAKFRNHALAAQQHELTLTRHYETLLQTSETQILSLDLVSSTEMTQSLQRLSHHLRGLFRSMAGEIPDPSDPIFDMNTNPDYETGGFVDTSELEHLLETLDERSKGGYMGADHRADWAIERESEIARLETENEELRKLLEIDEVNIAAKGLSIDMDRVESGRYSRFLRRAPSIGDGLNSRPSYWDTQPYQSASGAPLPRAMDLQPGMRMGQGRRTGIFGGGRGRGGLSGIGMGPGPGQNVLWNNQATPSVAIPDRPWPVHGSSELDITS